MKVGMPSQNVKKRCKAEKIDVDAITIDTILKFHYEDMLDKLVKGEEIRIPTIGKITPTYRAGVSYLNQTKTDYETIKFGFSPFKELKSKTKERLAETKKKHL